MGRLRSCAGDRPDGVIPPAAARCHKVAGARIPLVYINMDLLRLVCLHPVISIALLKPVPEEADLYARSHDFGRTPIVNEKDGEKGR